MIPDTIHFDELELRPREMLHMRLVTGPFPASWSRVVIEHSAITSKNYAKEWILENTYGRFGMLAAYPRAAIYFEDHKDAILFMMKDGADAIKSKES